MTTAAITATAVVTIALALLLRIYVSEAFIITGPAMMPSVAGEHMEATCPKCGGTVLVDRNRGVCSSCRAVDGYGNDRVARRRSPDRLFVNKLRRDPRRWQIVVVRYDEGPNRGPRIYRVAGLPGEKVFLDDGAVWINDAKAPLPPGMAGQRYESANRYGRPPRFAGKESPLVLAADEYFVLGDYSEAADDSRYSGPVRHDQIIGIAEVRYWPLRRFGSLAPRD